MDQKICVFMLFHVDFHWHLRLFVGRICGPFLYEDSHGHFALTQSSGEMMEWLPSLQESNMSMLSGSGFSSLKLFVPSVLALTVAVASYVYAVRGVEWSETASNTSIADISPAFQSAAAGPPPPPAAGIFNFEVDWPENGIAYNPQSGDTIRGYVSGAGVPVSVEAQDASGTWWSIGNTTSALNPSSVGVASTTPAYAWSLPAIIPSFWTQLKTKGGVLRLRATPYPNWSQFNAMAIPQTFDSGNSTCLTSAYASMTWTQAASNCGTLFPLMVQSSAAVVVGVTVLSTGTAPVDRYSIPNNLNKPTYISMVQPVSSAVPNNTVQPPFVGQLYYQVIQPPTTLAAFRTKYGFNSTGAGPYVNGEVESTYYNKGDLGIGRNMHCRRFTRVNQWLFKEKGLACYVKNYAKTFNGEQSGVFFGEDEDFVLDKTITQTLSNHFATVAMVQVDGSTRTDFIVYDQAGSLTPAARLDGTGHNAAVPTNCLSCHGGTYSGSTTAGGLATDARFLPFDSDPRILKFSTSNSAYTLAAQATNIRNLNMMIYNSAMTSVGVKKHITLMYGGNENAASPGLTYTNGYVPTTWQGSAQSAKLYTEVVHPYCIGCHLTYPNPGVTGYNPFASYTDFVNDYQTILHDVCTAHRMPNAQQTATNFWKGPGRAYLLNLLGTPTEACDP